MREREFEALAVGVLIAVLLVVVTTGTAAAQYAPRCSTVEYDGEGTEAEPYEVNSVDQLQCIEEQSLGANYTLVSDIDASGTSEWNGGAGFEPIGEDSDERLFIGTFEGANHTITGLTIDRPNENETGLFSSFFGEIRYINIVNVNANGSSGVGGLVGFNRGAVVGSSATGDINGSSNVGGLVGENGGTIEKSSASGNVSGSNTVGGLVGLNKPGSIRDSSASGNVDGSEEVGGLVGRSQSEGSLHSRPDISVVEDSSATGNVNGSTIVGGLVGVNSGGTVKSSSATGKVNGTTAVGGLLGANSGRVRDSSASGNVNGSEEVGGFAGFNSEPIQESSASGEIDGTEEVGGFVGINWGRVRESSASGDVNGSDEVGGLVGENPGLVEWSHATGRVTGSDKVGGLIGYNNRDPVSSSYATGSVTGSTEVGGLIGRSVVSRYPASSRENIRESYATGRVTGSERVGGLIGFNDGSTIIDSYWDTETTEQFSSDGGTGLRTEEMTGEDAPENMEGFDFSETWMTTEGYPAIGNVGNPDCSRVEYDGEGTEDSPYEIESVEQLQCVRDRGADEHYRLVSDVDASETSNWNVGRGFQPIDEFTGTLDGANHTVSDLTIDRRHGEELGLFGTIENNGTVRNVNLEDAHVEGWHTVGSLAGTNTGTVVGTSASVEIRSTLGGSGGLIGENSGMVTGSSASGIVDVERTPMGGGLMGGLVGENSGILNESYATANVTGKGVVGGLAGHNGGTVKESYASGSANGGGSVGGLVGWNTGTVKESYATGSSSGGGLVGENEGGTVEESYTTASVSSPLGEVGGLVVVNEGGTVADAYWDMNTTGQSSSDGGTGLTTEEMTGDAALENMDFDFCGTWVTTTEYPALAWEVDDRQADENRVDCETGGEDSEEDGGISDGEEGSERTSSDGDETEDNSGSEENAESTQPTPGFTAAAALVAFVTGIAVIARRERE